MEKQYVYDTNNHKFKKIIMRSYIFELSICLIVLVLFSILPSLGLYLLSFSQLNGPVFPTNLLIFMGSVSGIFMIIIIIFTFCFMVKQNVSVNFTDSNLSIRTESFLGKENITINYVDIKKLYIPFYTNNILWKKFVGDYPLICKNKKEIKDGQVRKYSKKVSRVVFWNSNINEIKELIHYCKNQSRNNNCF